MARPKSDSAQIALSFIQDKINKYDLIPGDTVSDQAISLVLNMSRTPVKEAILQLVQYNLVERQKTKFVVKAISLTDIQEIFEVRKAVETMSAKLIIQKGGLGKTHFRELEEIENKLIQSLDAKDYYNNFKYDALFHNTLVSFSSNSRFISIMETMTIQGERLRWLSIMTPQRYTKAIEEHKEILSAIATGEILQTVNCIQNHLDASQTNYEKVTSNSHWEDIIISFKKGLS